MQTASVEVESLPRFELHYMDKNSNFITLFNFKRMFCWTDNIMQNIPSFTMNVRNIM